MISSTKGIAESVFVTHDQNNRPIVVWTERGNDKLTLFYTISTDDGKTFSNKIGIPLTPDVATYAEGGV